MAEDKTEQEKVRIEYKISREFRVVFADAAILSQFGDGLATSIKITFTRTEPVVVAETFSGREEGGTFTQDGPPEFETAFQKTKEIAVLLRPDHAFSLAQALISNLSNLDDLQRERYRLPKIDTTSVTEENKDKK